MSAILDYSSGRLPPEAARLTIHIRATLFRVLYLFYSSAKEICMKSVTLFLVPFLLSAALWAQTTPPAGSAPAGQAPTQSAPPHGPMHHHMMAMHEKHVQEMKAQVEKMHATLDQMKANLAKLKDPAVKQHAQLDVDLWEAMVAHMDDMVKMMSVHGGMGMMGGHPPDKPDTQ
jgi:hypothetical protein